MKIRDSVPKEKQFKSIAPGSNRKKENDTGEIGKKLWGRDAKHTNDMVGGSEENADLIGTIVFWVYGCRCFGEG